MAMTMIDDDGDRWCEQFMSFVQFGKASSPHGR